MANLMAKRTEPNGLLFLGELLSSGRDFKPKMDELVSTHNLTYITHLYVGDNVESNVVIPVSDDILFCVRYASYPERWP